MLILPVCVSWNTTPYWREVRMFPWSNSHENKANLSDKCGQSKSIETEFVKSRALYLQGWKINPL
jgi:hypothetical protein